MIVQAPFDTKLPYESQATEAMQIYVHKDGQQYGPYTIEQLREYVQLGQLTTADHACFDGQNWVTVAQVPGLAGGAQAQPQQPQQQHQPPSPPFTKQHQITSHLTNTNSLLT